MSIDIIKIKNTDKKENLSKLKPESLDIGELALVRESNYERLYCKNTDGEVTPLNRVYDAGEFEIPLPTIQSEWIDSGLAQWKGNAMNRVEFNTGLTGDFTPPLVSDMDILTSMYQMFGFCSGLTSLDLSSFDTSNVTDMNYMFQWCSGLTSLDVSSFDTSNVIIMRCMFDSCTGLTSLDITHFDTSKVITMNHIFYKCINLSSLNLSSFNTSNVTDMTAMFSNCSGLTSLDVSKFDTSNVTYMNRMFQDCDELSKITCKQAFKNWCINLQDTINLPATMREGGSGTWIIVD